jgi:hypothetical protein
MVNYELGKGAEQTIHHSLLLRLEVACFYFYGVSQIQHSSPDFVLSLLERVAEGGNCWRCREAPIPVSELLERLSGNSYPRARRLTISLAIAA